MLARSLEWLARWLARLAFVTASLAEAVREAARLDPFAVDVDEVGELAEVDEVGEPAQADAGAGDDATAASGRRVPTVGRRVGTTPRGARAGAGSMAGASRAGARRPTAGWVSGAALAAGAGASAGEGEVAGAATAAPAHWATTVAERAPHLLDGGGLGMGPAADERRNPTGGARPTRVPARRRSVTVVHAAVRRAVARRPPAAGRPAPVTAAPAPSASTGAPWLEDAASPQGVLHAAERAVKRTAGVRHVGARPMAGPLSAGHLSQVDRWPALPDLGEVYEPVAASDGDRASRLEREQRGW